MTMAILPQIIPTAVEHTLDSLVGGLLLCAVAWIWLRVARRQNSASRFIILFILLIGIAVLPFADMSWTGHATVTTSASGAHALFTLPEHFAEYLFLGWATIASVLLARVAVGLFQLLRLKRNCVAIDAEKSSPEILSALAACKRQVELCTSDKVSVPTALGFSSPAKIAIPSWLLDQLSPEEIHHLVLHESAHLRRCDDWTNLAQRLLGALLFFHPAVWWLEARLSLEREMACDECVLAETRNARAYAKSLANIAERSFVHRTVALAQAAVSRLHETTLRVTRILSPEPRRVASRIVTFASIASVTAATLGVAAYSPNLIGFSAPPAPALASVSSSPALVKTDSMPVTRAQTASAKRNVSKPALHRRAVETTDTPTVAREQQPSLFVPAKAIERHRTATQQPAVLVVWQQTYSDGYVTVQQSYWQVVILHPPATKEQPAKIT